MLETVKTPIIVTGKVFFETVVFTLNHEKAGKARSCRSPR